jgi:hypothetical protein
MGPLTETCRESSTRLNAEVAVKPGTERLLAATPVAASRSPDEAVSLSPPP